MTRAGPDGPVTSRTALSRHCDDPGPWIAAAGGLVPGPALCMMGAAQAACGPFMTAAGIS
jgi:hypothetical protein